MSRTQFFVITSAVIFLLERVLPVLTSWPLFIFPVFAILFLLSSKNDAEELVFVVAISLFFDFFSGYTFGFSTLAILAVVLAVFFFKTRFNVNSQSFFSLAIYTLVFTFAYFAALSIKSAPSLIISQTPTVIIETLILFALFVFSFRKLIKKT